MLPRLQRQAVVTTTVNSILTDQQPTVINQASVDQTKYLLQNSFHRDFPLHTSESLLMTIGQSMLFRLSFRWRRFS